MFSALPGKLPIDPAVHISLGSGPVAQRFQPAYGSLSRAVTIALEVTPPFGGEPQTAIAVDRIFISVLLTLDSLLPPEKRIGLGMPLRAGPQFQFYAIERSSPGRPHEISAMLDMSNIQDRAYFRTDRLTVQKRISPWSNYCDLWRTKLKDIRRVYKMTANSAGLVHACIKSGPCIERDTYTVELQPVGLQRSNALPTTEEEACAAAHGVLHGLDATHSLVCC
ncbi:hypothetical protein WJX72_007943 [[Myrmecia] bisecta]|uniref:Uncharacterized protein n=1 Tax=[Myrmecia] bisecta TaxID=41462 RepID=A0AAW1R8A6_9CHLO